MNCESFYSKQQNKMSRLLKRQNSYVKKPFTTTTLVTFWSHAHIISITWIEKG